MKSRYLLAALVSMIATSASAIEIGAQAPDFTAKNQNDKLIHLKDPEYAGKFVLLYFYPKDETPGCTTQACALRDQYSEIKKLNAVVFGVSRQSAESHREFIAKHKLPFDLLVDESGAIGKAFGIGSIPLVGYSLRQSVLIDPSGKVIRFYKDVDPSKHAAEVMADLKKAGATPKQG